LEGGSYDHFKCCSGIEPKKEWIDEFTKENPAFISRYDGHQALVNSYVLKLANITKYTPNPFGGEIIKDENGEPTGLLKANAMELARKYIKYDELRDEEAVQLATDYFFKNGITTVYDMSSLEAYSTYKRVHDKNNLKIRIKSAIELQNWKLLEEINEKNKPNNFLFTNTLKVS
jgi:predicted amidohydrolase YtcJ